MKLVWSPEMAAKAFTDTVKSCELHQGSSVSELISAMAAGWNAKHIIETWCHGGIIATSIGLAVASTHTNGRHVCIVQDHNSKTEYITAMKKAGIMSPEVIIGEPEIVIKGLDVIDFLVVDSRKKDFAKILKVAKFGHRGAVLVCKNASLKAGSFFCWGSLFEEGGSRRIVRSVNLHVGKGLDIGHVGARDQSVLGLEKLRRANGLNGLIGNPGKSFSYERKIIRVEGVVTEKKAARGSATANASPSWAARRHGMGGGKARHLMSQIAAFELEEDAQGAHLIAVYIALLIA